MIFIVSKGLLSSKLYFFDGKPDFEDMSKGKMPILLTTQNQVKVKCWFLLITQTRVKINGKIY